MARAAPDDPAGVDFIATTERDEDPLGIDDTTGRELEDAAREAEAAARARAREPSLPTEHGEVLSGIRPLRETAHAVTVHWHHGLQRVRARLSLESRSRFDAELAYRYALPAGAWIERVSLCREGRCEQAARGEPEALRARYAARLEGASEAPPPGGFAEVIQDGRGPALAVQVAPLREGQHLDLVIEYALEQPVRGGTVRLALPARGYDPRAAPATLRFEAPDLALPELPDPLRLDPWVPLELAARYQPTTAATQRDTQRVPCDAGFCERRWRARPASQEPSPVELWALVDTSPSMEGPARSRVQATLRALAQTAPEEARLRVGVFDDTARWLGESAPAHETGWRAPLADLMLERRGARSRLSSALALVLSTLRESPPSHPVQVVVLSDGRLTVGAMERRAAARFRRRGLPSWVVGLERDPLRAERAALIDRAGADYLPVASVAEPAVVRGELDPLAERLAHLWRRPRSDGPAPGEQQLRLRPLGAAQQNAKHGNTAFLLGPHGAEPAGLRPQGGPLYRAQAYASAPPAPTAPSTGMPAESVLSLLRQQLVPKARACLRRDRRGRADYAVRATFTFLLERREILDARVQGELQPALRRCLDDLLGSLQIPQFSGRLRIRYPIHTEREPEPPTIELEPDIASDIDRLFDRERP